MKSVLTIASFLFFLTCIFSVHFVLLIDTPKTESGSCNDDNHR